MSMSLRKVQNLTFPNATYYALAPDYVNISLDFYHGFWILSLSGSVSKRKPAAH
jgi:hypothetical protein